MNEINKLHNLLKLKFIKRTTNHNPQGLILETYSRETYQNNVPLQYLQKKI